MISQTGIKLKPVKPFYDFYDRSKKIRYFGTDNLYPNSLKDYLMVSPSVNECVDRRTMFLGNANGGTLITPYIYSCLIKDYSLFNGFALYLSYDKTGVVSDVTYIPFETIRLGERGELGNYVNVRYCADWSGIDTVNTKRINVNAAPFFYLYTDNIAVRMKRINDAKGIYSDIFYYNGSTSVYPQSPVVPVLNYASTEVGVANMVYRDVRTNFTPAKVLTYQKQSDNENNEFVNALANLQGDENSFKILAMSYATLEEKPEVLDFSAADYTDRLKTVSDLCKEKIYSSFNQTQFLRLSDGGLGFGSDTISELYNYYNNILSPERTNIEKSLKNIDEGLTIDRLPYGSE